MSLVNQSLSIDEGKRRDHLIDIQKNAIDTAVKINKNMVFLEEKCTIPAKKADTTLTTIGNANGRIIIKAISINDSICHTVIYT